MQIATDDGMKQKDLGLDLRKRCMLKQTMLDEMAQIMPWDELMESFA